MTRRNLIKGNPQFTRRAATVAALVGVVAGINALVILAAGAFAILDPENAVLTGGARTIALSGAIGGKALIFGSAPAPTPAPTPAPPPAPTPGPPAPNLGYHVVGNTIRNGSGGVFTPHGVARPTMEWSCTGHDVNNGGNGIPASDYTTMRNGWSANAVRIALTQDFWLNGTARTCPGYAQTVASNVAAARNAGLIVILDLHWSDKGNLGESNPAQQCMADRNSVTFWQQVAATYRGDSGVWFELYNEPHDIDWNTWRNGGSACGFQAVGMQSLYQTVRNTGANNIVIATGDGWGAHLDGVGLLSGSNIAYGIHPYANRGTPDAWGNGDWDNRFGFLTPTAPVIATEFGRFNCGSTTYDQGILNYFRSRGVGYTAWAWYVGGCGFPSLIGNSQGACVEGGCATQRDMRAFGGSLSGAAFPPVGGGMFGLTKLIGRLRRKRWLRYLFRPVSREAD